MMGFPFGLGARRTVGIEVPVVVNETYGALSRAQEGAGIAVTGTSISSGDPSGHWQIASGFLFPSTAGDTADLNAGPYELVLDDDSTVNVTIEANTWDVATTAEWLVIAGQSAVTLAGKKIALRNSSVINLGITGGSGTPFRRLDLRDGSGNPLVVEGRFGEVGAWDDYCEIDRVQQLRGTRGVTFQHLRTSKTNVTKFALLGEASFNLDDITITDCDISGEVADPNGDYTTSSNYPNRNIDLITTAGTPTGTAGNITITNNRIQWAGNCVQIGVDKAGGETIITGNEIRYFYDDGVKFSVGTSATVYPVTISDNFITDPVGLPTDSDAQHPDAIQVIGDPTRAGDASGITIERNIILQGSARGVMQSIFIDDMKTSAGDSGFFFVVTARDNLIINNITQGIWVAQAKNCLIDNNTVVAWNEASVGTPLIQIGAGSSNPTNGGGNTATDNIADSLNIVAGSTVSNNFTAGLNGVTIAYSTLFDGPTFAPTTEAEAKAQFNPKAAANGAGAVIS